MITLEILKDNKIYTSELDGLKPLIKYLNENPEILEGSQVTDKIVGKASALLLIYGKVNKVHGKTMSKEADEILTKYHIQHSYDILTEHIINRQNTGYCPMEILVQNIDDPQQAYETIKNKIHY